MNEDLTEIFQQLQNKFATDDFEGLSPHQMHILLYDTSSEESPLQLQIFDEESLF